MKNQFSEGNALELVAPYNVASGAGFLVGSIFAVASFTALSGASITGYTRGAYSLAKVSAQAWTQGVLVYWDDSAKLCTTTSSGNKLIGTAMVAAANPSATGFVRLNGAFTS